MNEPWVPKLTQIVQDRVKKNEPFKRGELTAIFNELALEFKEEKSEKIMNYYYRSLKKLWDEDSSSVSSKKKVRTSQQKAVKSQKTSNSKNTNIKKEEVKTADKEQQNSDIDNNNPLKNKEDEQPKTSSTVKQDSSSLEQVKFVTTKPNNEPIKLAFLKSYPAPVVPINSFEEEKEPTTEWLNFSQINRNIDGDTFADYVQTLQNGNLIKKGVFSNKELEIIEIHALKRILGTFSGYSRNKRVKQQTEAISLILNADDTMIAQKREEYYYNSLQPNTTVDVEVKKVMDYGGICSVVEFPNITGLLHIGQVTKGFVKNIEDYLYEGQLLNVKILKIERDKGKIDFSAKHLDLKPLEEVKQEDYNFNESASAVELVDDEVELLPDEELESDNDYVYIQSLPESESNSETIPELQDSFEKTLENASLSAEWDRIVEYVKAAVGPLSPEAKKKTVALINEHGLFDFTLALQSTSRDFKADLGLLLLRETETKLREGLNDFQYKVKDHAVDRYIQRCRIDRDSYLKKHKVAIPKNEETAQRIFESIVKQQILYNLSESKVVIDTETHRYVTYKGLYYPCQRIQNGSTITYLARTVLTQRMVEKNFDELILEKYTEE